HRVAPCPQELRSGSFWRGVLAEAVATLIFVGVVLGASAAPGPLAPALAGGLVAGGLACTLGDPQANPALTVALLCTRKLGVLRGAAGLLAQCAGATLASAAARLALPDDASLVTRESVKDLIRYLRHEDESRDVRQQLGAAQILQNDLLPILVQYPQEKVLFDAVVRLMVNLTQPALLCFGKVPADATSRHHFLQVLSYLQAYKEVSP
ncbi:PREDICTED: protein timeless homolog, partial [Calidris pugnax]|uniref:protein timeless homolog n=1 Tax=Calidris pugnax TaxID=198806 RepID=UPI00071E138B